MKTKNIPTDFKKEEEKKTSSSFSESFEIEESEDAICINLYKPAQLIILKEEGKR